MQEQDTRTEEQKKRDERIKQERKKIEDLAKVAQWYYIEEREQKDIADRLGKSGASTAARLLKTARERGIIEFNIDASYAIGGHEEPSLSRSLRDAFDLDDAVAVRIDTCSDYTQEEDNYLHQALANHAGLKIRNQIQPNDHIALGSGRSIYQIAKVIKRDPPSRKGVHITPLSGRVWARQWEMDGPYTKRPLDADDAARLLALAFENEPGTIFNQVSYPLFTASSVEASEIMKSHCLFLPDGSWFEKPPRLAVVGVGVLSPASAHRYATLEEYVDNPALMKAAKEITALIEWVKTKDFPPVGDVSNCLFPVLRMPGEVNMPLSKKISSDYKEITKRVGTLNQSMVAVRWEHLRATQSVIAVTGGPHKLKALWTLLIGGVLVPHKKIINGLYTDAETAKSLISAIEIVDDRKDLKNWYSSLLPTFFGV